MRQGDLSRLWDVPSTHQTCMANSMMRRTEGTMSNERCACGKLICNRIDTCYIQRLFDAHFRQDAGHSTRQQCFTSSRRANHKDVMPPSRGHFEGALDMFLPS